VLTCLCFVVFGLHPSASSRSNLNLLINFFSVVFLNLNMRASHLCPSFGWRRPGGEAAENAVLVVAIMSLFNYYNCFKGIMN
jgi:hypothetical protein